MREQKAVQQQEATQEEAVAHEQKITQEVEVAHEQKVMQDQDATQVREAAPEQKKLRKRKSAQKRKAVHDENAGLTTEQPATKRSPTKSIPVQASPARSTAIRAEPRAVEPKDVPLPSAKDREEIFALENAENLDGNLQIDSIENEKPAAKKKRRRKLGTKSRRAIGFKDRHSIENIDNDIELFRAKAASTLAEKRKKRERKAARSNVDVLMPLMGESNFGRGKRTKRQQR